MNESLEPQGGKFPANTLAANLEALLFLVGEPVGLDELGKATGASVSDLNSGLRYLEEQLVSRGSGMRLLRAPHGVQLVTAPEQEKIVEQFIKAGMRQELTPAAAETLAIVGYRGPISRAGVEAIRGVNSSFTLRLLTIRGLLERTPSPKDQRVLLYEVSAEFLRHIGLQSVRELSDYEALQAHAGMAALEATAESSPKTAESGPSSPGAPGTVARSSAPS